MTRNGKITSLGYVLFEGQYKITWKPRILRYSVVLRKKTHKLPITGTVYVGRNLFYNIVDRVKHGESRMIHSGRHLAPIISKMLVRRIDLRIPECCHVIAEGWYEHGVKHGLWTYKYYGTCLHVHYDQGVLHGDMKLITKGEIFEATYDQGVLKTKDTLRIKAPFIQSYSLGLIDHREFHYRCDGQRRIHTTESWVDGYKNRVVTISSLLRVVQENGNITVEILPTQDQHRIPISFNYDGPEVWPLRDGNVTLLDLETVEVTHSGKTYRGKLLSGHLDTPVTQYRNGRPLFTAWRDWLSRDGTSKLIDHVNGNMIVHARNGFDEFIASCQYGNLDMTPKLESYLNAVEVELEVDSVKNLDICSDLQSIILYYLKP